ncbi:MAG: hypothetical protein IJ763_00985 [Lachnospiraceae bacterium]|nr:hypothetical protein [Lachnospiraceae bacterium]
MYNLYKPYLYDNDRHIYLNSEGWTKLIHQSFDKIIEDNFGMHPIKERCWADNYKDGRRRVISIFLVNDMFATLKYGWNFNYIPRTDGRKKISWCRTDKTIYTHTFKLSEDFINYNQKKRKSVFGRNGYTNDPSGFNLLMKEHKTAWDTIYPEIFDYYEKTSTYEGLLNNLRELKKSGYYNLINSGNHIVYIFVEKYTGNDIQAEKDFEELQFYDEQTKNDFYKKLQMVNNKI